MVELTPYRQAKEEPFQEVPWCRQGQGPEEEQELRLCIARMIVLVLGGWWEIVARKLAY